MRRLANVVMPIIHIETQPIARNQYELIQTWVDDLGNNFDERIYIETHDDRMYAAMTNLGKACRWLNDAVVTRGAVCIVSDTDGKDVRFGGEHNDLFEAIHSRADYLKNRTKYGLIYGRYLAYLDRIRDLADENEITFTQDDTVKVSIVNKAAEFEREFVPFVDPATWTAENIVRISLKGSQNTVYCMACPATIVFQQTDSFKKMSKPNGKDKRGKDRYIRIKNPKELIAWFTRRHLERHGIKTTQV